MKIPKTYQPLLDIRHTEKAIKLVKDHFEKQLAETPELTRVSAPLFVRPESGLNDDLNGVERAVSFDIPHLGTEVQIVQSLAKWKRLALKRYGFQPGEGLYTDMNAIRRDETLDALHSVYVDQWDWEKTINEGDRTEATLKATVETIYGVIKQTEKAISWVYGDLKPTLPETIAFIDSEELYRQYPDETPKMREYLAAKAFGAVFIMRIGDLLSCGERHDSRAPDYDDWSLNGDIIVYSDIIDQAIELSSMGIRVDAQTLVEQLKKSGESHKLERPYHKMLAAGELPFTIGGGIGQSRLCMFFLRKAHIGEVQASLWDEDWDLPLL